ncbi:MAG: hypothetical protein ACE5EB_06455 [Thermodesulfobacteriota bacterium]
MKTPPISILFCILFFLLSLVAAVSVPAHLISPLPGEKEFQPEKPYVDKVHIRVKMPIRPALKPINFDDRDGLDSMETALLAVIMNSNLRLLREGKGVRRPQVIEGGIVPGFKLAYSLKSARAGGFGAKTSETSGLGRSTMALIAESAGGASAAAEGASIELDTAWQEWQVFTAARLYFSLHNIARKRAGTLRRLKNVYKGLFKALKKYGRGKKRHKELIEARAAFKGTKLKLEGANNELNMYRVNLSHITGIPSSVVLPLKQDNSALRPKRLPKLKTLLKGMDTKRLDLLALKTGAKNEDAALQGAILSRFPEIESTVPGSLMVYVKLLAAAGVSIDFPFFKKNYGQSKVEKATGRELLEVYNERLEETKDLIPVILGHLKRTAADLSRVDKDLAGLKRKAGRSRKASRGGGKKLIEYYRSTEKVLLTELLRIKYERRLTELEAALEAETGRVLFVDTPHRPAKR